MSRKFFTSESVSMGHPDKVADQISDAVLDACLTDDPESRVACETLVSTGLVVISGEITTKTYVDCSEVARAVIKEIGYNDPALGFDHESCAVLVNIKRQSSDISQGVSKGKGLHKEQGAGDQGMMFGYACDETPELMPLPIELSHALIKELQKRRFDGDIKYLRPDSKSQVTVEYDENDIPRRVEAVVISTQHSDDVEYDTIYNDMVALIKDVISEDLLDDKTIYHINPTGRFVIGGPKGDCGVTGRKIIVDTYGGIARHGGGCFSGKDPSKVDRSGAYMARYIAKNIVAAGLAKRCEIQLAYAIGVAEPVSIKVDTFGTGTVTEDILGKAVRKVFDITPRGIIKTLDLKRPIYRNTAYGGHFGRTEKNFTWERIDRVKALKKAVDTA
ncbi:MAG: methionine adenosyltransferase [Waddliaceae bacterium]|jgi:S-adenosylmethionine synthetase|nr:methionine adenosyltransferase [Waddliaceae bacterium]MBT3578731.1 methionine adenosyltransferase [Waddliaceae bacterium]MBT4444367.1 methionine adenosyltransferase [Waddliaceae bacterium]MBT6928282.1 methionine adenosyltransferase [Waddliaceae bacterium]MBT7264968.1 methionine adenosyltransferase [Waddliaceae bacterium]